MMIHHEPEVHVQAKLEVKQLKKQPCPSRSFYFLVYVASENLKQLIFCDETCSQANKHIDTHRKHPYATKCKLKFLQGAHARQHMNENEK